LSKILFKLIAHSFVAILFSFFLFPPPSTVVQLQLNKEKKYLN
jgi:hypothetical protein